jgi:hypothetical protein
MPVRNVVPLPLTRLKTVHGVVLSALLWLAPAGFADVLASDAVPRLARIRVSRDGHGFESAEGRRFVPFGVTYFRPGTGWAPQLWKRFDEEATRRDFARMKELGVNCVRLFLTYGSFYTEPGRLSPDGLAKFDRLLEIAEQAGIRVHPTGPDHWEGLPEWTRGDRIADEVQLRALEAFWREFASRYRGRPVIFAYDLLNEPEVRWDTPVMREKWNRWLAQRYGAGPEIAQAWEISPDSLKSGEVAPPLPKDAPGDRRLLDFQRFREDVADEWTRRQAQVIKAADPDALVTVGLIQWSVPTRLAHPGHYAAFRPDRQAKFLDFLEVHFYPLADGAYEYAGAESEGRNLAYLESVVREVAKPGKPVVLAEFGWYGGGKPKFDGGRHPFASKEQQAQWCRRVVETTAGLAAGWLNWGFYDHPEAQDVSELIGLVTVEGRTKSWGVEFQKLVARFGGGDPPPRLLGPRPALDWEACATSAGAGRAFGEEYWREFVRQP